MKPRARLVINADDFGLCEPVNRGIVEAQEAGAVTSASLMVGTPGFADAVTRALETPRLGVGLHFNMTTGRPLSPSSSVASLCDARTGAFCGLRRLVARALARRVSPLHVAAECTAQLAAMRATGLSITHLDVHHHAHSLPGLMRPILDVCRGDRVAFVRPPLTFLRRASAVKAVRHADHFRGFAITGRPDFERRVLSILDHLRPGVTELMVHPGYWDHASDGLASLTWRRQHELAALTSPAVRARLRRGDIELVHFGEV